MASSETNEEDHRLDELNAHNEQITVDESDVPCETSESTEREDYERSGGPEELVDSATPLPHRLNEPVAPLQPEEQEQTEGQDEADHAETAGEHEESESAKPPAQSEHPVPPLPRFDEQYLWKLDKVENFPEGFPQAAAIVNADPNFAIFRGFSRGRTRLILQDQAELTMLENKIDACDREISDTPDARYILYQSGLHLDPDWPEAAKNLYNKNHKYLEEFRRKLEEFDNEIFRYYKLRRMPPPSQHARKNIGRWFYQNAPLVEGQNDHITHIEDLVTVGKGEKDSWMEGGIANALEWKSLRIFKKFFVAPEQRKKARDTYGLSDQVHYHCPERLKTMADTGMVALASILALLPFYILFNLEASIIALVLLSSLISAHILSISTAAERHHLFMVALSQSTMLALGALVAQVPSGSFISSKSAREVVLEDVLARILHGQVTKN